MKNVVKKESAVPRQFLGVDFVVLSVGTDTMVTKMLYKALSAKTLLFGVNKTTIMPFICTEW